MDFPEPRATRAKTVRFRKTRGRAEPKAPGRNPHISTDRRVFPRVSANAEVGVRHRPAAFPHATKQILDNWGDQGYELVSVLPGPTGEQLVAYMKRPIEAK